MGDFNLHLLQSQLDDFINPPLIISRANGLNLETIDGRRLLDLSSGYWLVCLGYGNQELIETMTEAATQLSYAHLFRFVHKPALELAEKLVELAKPLQFNKVLFGNSGSEAMEIALQLVARYADIRGISDPAIAFLQRGYHGSTFLEQCLTTFRHYPTTFSIEQKFHALPSPLDDRMAEQSLAELETLAQQGQLAAFVCEPIQGVGGVVVPPSWYFPEVRKICDQYSTLLVFDEASTGVAVTGNWFGFQTVGGDPDIVALAKRLGGGYFPISAVLANTKLSRVFENGFEYGHTTAGHPVACKVALKVLEIIERDNLIQAASTLGRKLRHGLSQSLTSLLGQGAISGSGLMVGIRTPDSHTTKLIQCEAIARGVLFIGEGRFVVLCPSLTITEDQIDLAVSTLETATNAAMSVSAAVT
jgi:adenosylmethionine-8-amino-7-oxononanoate aminotransferase